ncbi:hypothetical protein BDR22DRAFT_889751 [Usnea florida]
MLTAIDLVTTRIHTPTLRTLPNFALKISRSIYEAYIHNDYQDSFEVVEHASSSSSGKHDEPMTCIVKPIGLLSHKHLPNLHDSYYELEVSAIDRPSVCKAKKNASSDLSFWQVPHSVVSLVAPLSITDHCQKPPFSHLLAEDSLSQTNLAQKFPSCSTGARCMLHTRQIFAYLEAVSQLKFVPGESFSEHERDPDARSGLLSLFLLGTKKKAVYLRAHSTSSLNST